MVCFLVGFCAKIGMQNRTGGRKAVIDISKRLKEVGAASGMTEEDMAVLTGRTRRTVRKWLCGESLPKVPDVEKICGAVGVEMYQFFEEREMEKS